MTTKPKEMEQLVRKGEKNLVRNMTKVRKLEMELLVLSTNVGKGAQKEKNSFSL